MLRVKTGSSDKEPSVGRRVRLFSRISIRAIAAILVTITVLILLNLLFVLQMENNTVELRKEELKRLVTIGSNAIEPILAKLKQGEMDRRTALEKTRETIRTLIYAYPSTQNYLFMSAYDGTMLVQPFEPQKENTDQWNLKDSHGTYIIRELINTAKEGGGFVEYYYPPPGEEEPQKKISYVVGIDALDCYLGTGLYLHDIFSLYSQSYYWGILSIIITFLIFILILGILFRPYYTAYNFLKTQFTSIAQNPDSISSVPASYPRDSSETGVLLQQFQTMLRELQETRAGLENSLKEKEVLLREIHHRVKNNLQIISSLLNLQAAGLNDDSQNLALQDSAARIRAMSLIHESLYTQDQFHRLNISLYVHQLVGSINQLYFSEESQPDYRFDVEPISLEMDTAITCGLIITELITNAIKHAFPHQEHKICRISFKKLEEDIILQVSDNGIGIPKHIINRGSSSLGMSLVDSLTDQLEGSLSVEADNGTTFTIIFPAAGS